MRRTATWPEPPPYGPGYGAIWKSLYDRFGLDFASSLDMAQPDEHWERYLYFNAGWFLGTDGPEFGRRFAGEADWRGERFHFPVEDYLEHQGRRFVELIGQEGGKDWRLFEEEQLASGQRIHLGE